MKIGMIGEISNDRCHLVSKDTFPQGCDHHFRKRKCGPYCGMKIPKISI